MATLTAHAAGPALSPTNTSSPIAAIVHLEHGVADGVLADFAFALRQAGRRVRGVVQQSTGGTGKEATMLVDLDHGTRFPLFQRLGGDEPGVAHVVEVDAGGVEHPRGVQPPGGGQRRRGRQLEAALAADEFDPRLHEALMQMPVPADELPEGVEMAIHDVMQVGFRINDQVIRPARVVVAVPADE